MTLNNIAVKKELIRKPSTNFAQIIIIPPLITNKNRPSVSIVAGKDNITKIGLTNILSNPSTDATITAVIKLSTSTFDINLEISITKTAVIKILIKSFMY